MDNSLLKFAKKVKRKKFGSNGSSSKREDCVRFAMYLAGWDRARAERTVDHAKNDLGIPYGEYVRFELPLVPENELSERHQERLQALRTVQKNNDAKYLNEVVEITGMSRDEAVEKMTHAQDLTGASFENYRYYEFWKLDDEQQKTYYTKGDVKRLKAKYNRDSIVRYELNTKDVFNRRFEKYLGRPWMLTEDMDRDSFRSVFGAESRIMFKPTKGTAGAGIRIYDLNEDNIDSVYDEIAGSQEGIVEGFLKQHRDMCRFSVNAVNTIRLVTVMTQDENAGIEPNKVHFLYAGLRMGVGDQFVDNMHCGGLTAVIDLETGRLATDGINYRNEVFEKHPDTGETIKGSEIPCFREMIEMISSAGLIMPGFVGWDIAISENGPVIIEANTSPGTGVLQTPYALEGRGMRHVIEKYL